MRAPVRLTCELGLRSFLVAQFVLFGMVFSTLVHPLMIVAMIYLAYTIASGAPFGSFDLALIAMDMVGVFGGYAGFLVLGWTRLKPAERSQFWRLVVATPFYWMLISVCAWKAVRDLWLKPFHWDKTSHKPLVP